MTSYPYFILADEPTGNLDSHTTDEILKLFTDLNASGKTIILVTHEDEVAAHVKRVVRLRDGRLQSDERKSVACHVKREAAGSKDLCDHA